MKLKEIENIDSGIIWISDVFMDCDWPLYFFVRLQYTDYYSEEWRQQVGKYHIEINAVSTEAAGPKNCEEAARSFSMNKEEFDKLPVESQHQILMEYGIAARLYAASGSNKEKLLKKMKAEMAGLNIMIGFRLDGKQNAIGQSGWDLMRGQDIREHLKKISTPEAEIMKKMDQSSGGQ